LEEKERLDALLQEMGAPSAMGIEKTQGHLTLRQIIHTDARSGDAFASNEKVVLFYDVPQKGVFFLINAFKQADLPQPIYAVVTDHSMEWPFSKLLEHLVSERDSMEKRSDSKAGE
jgi:hypothetical protein